MRYLIIVCLLALCGCVPYRSEGYAAGSYHGITMQATTTTEPHEEGFVMLTTEKLAEIAEELRTAARRMDTARESAEEAADKIDRIIAANTDTTKDALESLGLKPRDRC